MGNGNNEVLPADSRTSLQQHFHGYLPASPKKWPTPAQMQHQGPFIPPPSCERPLRISPQTISSSGGRRHSVGAAPVFRSGLTKGSFCQQDQLHRQYAVIGNSRGMDSVFYETDDFSDEGSSVSDGMANSPTMHRKVERSRSEPVGPPAGMFSPLNGQQQPLNRYKTELCRAFLEAGHCKYGEKCQFAHGSQEIRDINRHPKYKTEYCRSFHSTGICCYGIRCHFIHGDSMKSAVGKTVPGVPVAAESTRVNLPSGNTTLSITSSQLASRRSRAVSLCSTVQPPAPHVPILENFILDQSQQLGSCGNSGATISSYSSTPLSMSPGGVCGWPGEDKFQFGFGSGGGYDYPGEALGPWTSAVENLLLDIDS